MRTCYSISRDQRKQIDEGGEVEVEGRGVEAKSAA